MAGTAGVLKGINRLKDVLVPDQKGLDDLVALLEANPSTSLTDEVSVFTAATDAFTRANLNCTVAQSLERLSQESGDACSIGKLTVRGICECGDCLSVFGKGKLQV